MKFYITVSIDVEVEIEEAKFTPEFMEEFRRDFYPFELIEDHAKHLAQLRARGLVDDHSFIEGYGRPENMGIKTTEISVDTLKLEDRIKL